MHQEKLNRIIRDWITKRITAEEAMQSIHRLNNPFEYKEKMIKSVCKNCGTTVIDRQSVIRLCCGGEMERSPLKEEQTTEK